MKEQERSGIGFIGFGEVGSALSQRIKETGGEVVVYDKFPDAVQEKAERLGIQLVVTLEDLVNSSRFILSCVWPDVASDTAREVVPLLSPEKIFCDMNSISPETTEEIERGLAR